MKTRSPSLSPHFQGDLGEILDLDGTERALGIRNALDFDGTEKNAGTTPLKNAGTTPLWKRAFNWF
jgi:hypothetical protein